MEDSIKQRVLVTGASGWLGRNLVRTLLGDGYSVVAVDRAVELETHEDLIHLCVDVSNAAELMAVAGDKDIHHLIHAAAVTASPLPDPLGVTRYLGTHLSMADACLQLAAEHGATATLISSAAVFDASQPAPLDEDAPTLSTGPYASAKRASELLWLEAASAGLDGRIVRFGNLVGPDERASETRPHVSLVQRFVNAARQERSIRVENPDAERDWTWLPGVARYVSQNLSRAPISVVQHVVASGSIRDLELARIVAAAFQGVSIDVASTPHNLPRAPLTTRHRSIQEGLMSIEQALARLLEITN